MKYRILKNAGGIVKVQRKYPWIPIWFYVDMVCQGGAIVHYLFTCVGEAEEFIEDDRAIRKQKRSKFIVEKEL